MSTTDPLDASSPARTVPGPARRWDAASHATEGPTLLGVPLTALLSALVLLVGTLGTVALAHGRPLLDTALLVVAGALLTGIGSSVAWLIGRPPHLRRAFEAFAYLGEIDLERARALTDGEPPVTVPAMRRYAETVPERDDDRWLRVEILVAGGDLPAARQMAERMPVGAPFERFEREAMLAYVDWVGGGPGDDAAMRASAAEMQAPDAGTSERIDITLALHEVRARVATRSPDATAPLREARARLPTTSAAILAMVVRRQAPGLVKLAGAGIAILTLIDHAA